MTIKPVYEFTLDNNVTILTPNPSITTEQNIVSKKELKALFADEGKILTKDGVYVLYTWADSIEGWQEVEKPNNTTIID